MGEVTMRAMASSFHAWQSIERLEGIKVPHGLVFPLAVVEALGRPHGLKLVAEEHTDEDVRAFDAVFISVLDSRCMVDAAKHFRKWGLPFRRTDRTERDPLVFAGGQGLHNPRPFGPVADVIVIGDAEDPLPALLRLWHSHGARGSFMSAASTVSGVFVPARHNPREVTIQQAVADDIQVTMRHDIVVGHDGSRRLEIARGCKYKCAFCSLGWRTPLRENSAPEVSAEILRSPKRVHLQAGDAESHSGIDGIRASLKQRGGYDQGWTGRLDTLFENPDQTIPGQKRYAFGVEGVSHRLRRAVGKGYLTDDRLVQDTCRFFSSIEDDETKGRAAWHVISGLPTERAREALDLMNVIQDINERRRGKVARNLTINWQPFQPLPGTPMQWCAAGGGARRKIGYLRGAEGLPWVRVKQHGGRTDDMCKLTTVLARSDERGADVLEAIADRGKLDHDTAAEIAGIGYGALDPDAPAPWDFIAQHYGRETLRKAYDVVRKRLEMDDGRDTTRVVCSAHGQTAQSR